MENIIPNISVSETSQPISRIEDKDGRLIGFSALVESGELQITWGEFYQSFLAKVQK